MGKIKILLAWIILIVLIVLLVLLNYFKFFNNSTNDISNNENTNHETNHVQVNLEEIANILNSKISQIEYDDNIKINSTSKNNSLYISYKDDKETTTYEFLNSGNTFKINVDNNKENLEKFKMVLTPLIEVFQEKLNNSNDIKPYIDDLFNNNKSSNAISVEVNNEINTYYIEMNQLLDNKTLKTDTEENNANTEQ